MCYTQSLAGLGHRGFEVHTEEGELPICACLYDSGMVPKDLIQDVEGFVGITKFNGNGPVGSLVVVEGSTKVCYKYKLQVRELTNQCFHYYLSFVCQL